jgi:Flp pilus assembly secretin CpaC/tetratricopeptide (TPR) repeat protein
VPIATVALVHGGEPSDPGQVLLSTPLASSEDAAGHPSVAMNSPADALLLLAMQEQRPSNAELLRRGQQEFRNNNYEEALSLLQQIEPEMLPASDQRLVAELLAKAEDSVNRRRAARAQFERGEAALSSGDALGAIGAYKSVLTDRHADSGTKAKAREQLALAEANLRQSGLDLKSIYNQAVSEFKSGEFAAARDKFMKLDAAGFNAGFFARSPADYVRDINKQIGPMEVAPPAVVTVPSEPQPMAEEPPVVSEPAPEPAPVAQAPAEQPAPADEPAPAEQPAPVATGPAETPAEQVVVTPPPAEAPSEPQPAEPSTPPSEPAPAEVVVPEPVQPTLVDPAPPTPAEPVQEITPPAPPMPEPRVISTAEAKAAYELAKKQYRQGDWISARQNFNIARDANYKPGLFEGDPPARYLARMDAKEARDRARTEAEIARRARLEAERAARAAATETPPPEPPASEPVIDTPVVAPPVVAETTAEPPPATDPAPAEPPVAAKPPPPTTESPVVQPGTEVVVTPVTPEPSAADSAAKLAEAQALVDQAEAARAAGRLTEADALYVRALELDPTNTAAAAGRASVRSLTSPMAEGATDLLTRRELEIRARKEAITYSFENALARAAEARSRNDYDTARAQLELARVARNTDATIFTAEEISAFDTRLAGAAADLAQSEQIYLADRAAAERARTEQDLREREFLAEEQRRSTVADLTRRAQILAMEQKYVEALGVVDQILVIDPRNDYAIGVRPLIEDRRLLFEQRTFREEFARNFSQNLNEAEERRIPYTDILRYPANWPDLSERRERSVAAERGELTEDSETVKRLDQRLPEINMNGVPFTDVVDFLRDVTQANIFVNWKALEASGIGRDAPVTARLRDVKFSKALRTILDDVSGGAVPLSYTIDEGVITISTEEDLSKNVLTRVYDIRDLIINVPDFEAPTFTLQGSSTGGGGGGGNLFGGGGGQGQGQQGQTRQDLEEAIISLIQDTVASDSWKDNGGTVGSIRSLGGQLIVTQTPENQRDLVRLLEQLRETRAIQVTVEVRYLIVARNYLEDIGVDFDFSFHNEIDGENRRLFGFDPLTGTSTGNIPFNNRTSDYTSAFRRDPTNPARLARQGAVLNTNVPGNLGLLIDQNQLAPAFSTGLTFLDDFQVSLLIRATQANVDSSVATSPRVTLFNGQRAFINIATETAFVSDLTPVVGQNAVAFDPEVGIVQSGVSLDVQATVSSDRKYVTLTLRNTLSQLRALVSFPVSSTTQGGGDGGGIPSIVTGFIQQPTRDITQVNTTVSVPDGGTLLLGGQTLSGEIEREAGTPGMSKIPFLKRLFTNRSMAKDDVVLLILVKPTIIIQREREQEQFPILSTEARN